MAEPGPVVLLIEDEPQMRRFLRAALEPHGYHLVEAETAREGMGHAAAHNPDVVLLDLGLPDLDGLEVTRRIREWSRVPIIVLSARGQESDKVAALDAGADDYLTKPFTTEGRMSPSSPSATSAWTSPAGRYRSAERSCT
jgi:two-component system KDP operon response regulator KdpE